MDTPKDIDVDNSLTPMEVRRRLPEIEDIEDDTLREQTSQAFCDYCPDYFWENPASSSGKYHPVHHREKHGLWLHTKRAFTAYQRLVDSFVHQDRISEFEADCGRAGILLHDIFKYGWDPVEDHTVSDHDEIAARTLGVNTDLHPDVIGCIDSHNGPWYDGKNPEGDLELLHHMADMAASDVNMKQAVRQPSKELRDQFPGVWTAGDSAIRETAAQHVAEEYGIEVTSLRKRPHVTPVQNLDTVYWDELGTDAKDAIMTWADHNFNVE